MAEGFARTYGRDVLVAASSGLAPVPSVVPETVAVMLELNIDVSKHVPMQYDPFLVEEYDLVVNMSGYRLPGKPPKQLLEWKISDPFQRAPDVYRKVRDEIEDRVMGLILRLRKELKA